jgi:hypothetical protein
MSIKGYADQQKTEAGLQFATVNPIHRQQNGLDVVGHISAQAVATDTAETGSTTTSIKATAHSAVRGDIISFRTGTLAMYEVRVGSVTADTIIPVETMPAAPSNGDSFKILRQKSLQVTSDGDLGVSIAADVGPGIADLDTLRSVEAGREVSELQTNDHSSVNVTTGAYVQLIASTSAAISWIYIVDTSGSMLKLAVGGAGSEVDKLYLGPGVAGVFPLYIPAGSRVSLRAIDASATSGRLLFTGLK